jgi:oligopeptidase B
MSLQSPKAEKRPVATTHHGVTLIDDYDWLRAANWQEAARSGRA